MSHVMFRNATRPKVGNTTITVYSSKQQGRQQAHLQIKELMNMRTELTPIYDTHKSFYKKAYVESYGSFEVLESYGTIIAILNKNGTVELTESWDYSRTTARHLAEFLRQHGFDSPEVGVPALRKALKRKNVYGNVLSTTEHAIKNRVFQANIGKLQKLYATA